jgi:hypothetical protein
VVRSSGGQRRVLSEGWAVTSAGLAWSADGREIWFTSKMLPILSYAPERLYAVTLQGRQREIVRVPGDLRLLDIARDSRVMLARWDWSTGLRAFGPGLDSERELSWFGHSFVTDLSSDGSSVLFSDREESLLLRKLDPALRRRGLEMNCKPRIVS